MKHRSPAAPLLLPIITIGIYSLVWLVKTKNELNAIVSQKVPTAWMLILPIANWIWYYNFGKAISSYTGGKTSAGGTFWLLLLLGPIGAAIIQSGLNSAGKGAAVSAAAVPAVA